MYKKITVGIATVIAVLLGMATVALAVNKTATGGANNGIAVAVSDDNATTTGATYVNLPGMALTLTTPADSKTLLDIRFSAESACYGGDAGSPDWCTVQIMVDGQKAMPNNCGNSTDFAFDSTDNGAESSASWESHAMERLAFVAGGTHRITVQGAVVSFGSAAPIFWTGERNLTVESFPRLTFAGPACPTSPAAPAARGQTAVPANAG
jgi:hypothetical protein